MSGCNPISRLQKNGWSIQLIFCVIFFASAAWIQINGIWVELPLIVAKSPQQWSLPSYLTVVIQIGNITPMLYLLITKYVKCGDDNKIIEIPSLYCILISELVLSFLLAFTWDKTSEINGGHYSTWLIAINFLIASADALSSVTFLPFMAYFPQMYMVVFYIGAGMSGFLPSIAALIQGLGPTQYTCEKTTLYDRNATRVFVRNTTNLLVDIDNSSSNNGTNFNYNQFQPRFSVKIFFFFLTGLLLLSLIAFIFLVRIKDKMTSKKEFNMTSDNKKDTTELGRNNQTYVNDVDDSNDISLDDVKSKKDSQNDDNLKNTSDKDDVKVDVAKNDVEINRIENNDVKSKDGKSDKPISRSTVGLLLVINCVINGLSNGVLPAVQSYACLPYGSDIYHLTLTLSSAINPIACFLYFFISIKSARFIFIGFLLYLTSSAYTIGIASYSPCPLLNDSVAGGVIVLIVTVLGVGLVSYLRTAIGTILQQQGPRTLQLCGISIQLGSLIGALIIFPLVSVYGVFKQSIPCRKCPYG